MKRNLKEILAEVLVFPYEQGIVDALKDACLKYVEAIELGQFEECVLHLCLDIPASDLIQSINTQTNRKFPSRVYRALAGYVVGEVLDNDNDEDDNVVFPLALRNAMKAKDDDADGIISKTIDPACFVAVEDYWKENVAIPSIIGKDIVSKESNGICCAWSNEAFELWYLYHFVNRTTGMSRSEYQKAISKAVNSSPQYKLRNAYQYAKNDIDNYRIMTQYGSMDKAILYAEAMSNQYTDQRYATHNPCTMVFRLVRQLIGKDNELNEELKRKIEGF